MFREAGLDPALIGYKRIERCLARWRESQDEIRNSGNAKAGVEIGGGFRFGAFPLQLGAPNIPRVREQREARRDWRNGRLPAGTCGSESDFHVSPERRAIIFPVSRKEQNNDLRDC